MGLIIIKVSELWEPVLYCYPSHRQTEKYALFCAISRLLQLTCLELVGGPDRILLSYQVPARPLVAMQVLGGGDGADLLWVVLVE